QFTSLLALLVEEAEFLVGFKGVGYGEHVVAKLRRLASVRSDGAEKGLGRDLATLGRDARFDVLLPEPHGSVLNQPDKAVVALQDIPDRHHVRPPAEHGEEMAALALRPADEDFGLHLNHVPKWHLIGPGGAPLVSNAVVGAGLGLDRLPGALGVGVKIAGDKPAVAATRDAALIGNKLLRVHFCPGTVDDPQLNGVALLLGGRGLFLGLLAIWQDKVTELDPEHVGGGRVGRKRAGRIAGE